MMGEPRIALHQTPTCLERESLGGALIRVVRSASAIPPAFASLLLLCSCGDTATETETPLQLRYCGELDGVEPVEPTVTSEDEYGCPVFEPVPCTRPRQEQEWACGSDCRTATAFDSNGDEWVMGCAGGSRPLPAGCIDLEPDLPPLCVVDPFAGEQWWFRTNCAAANILFVSQSCWAPCDAQTQEVLVPFCP